MQTDISCQLYFSKVGLPKRVDQVDHPPLDRWQTEKLVEKHNYIVSPNWGPAKQERFVLFGTKV